MKENPEPKEANEIRELIRAKIDIYGLTEQDIEDIRTHMEKILERSKV